MLRFACVFGVGLLLAPAWGQEAARPSSTRATELNSLFEALKHAQSGADAESLISRISEIWGQSDSDTATVLYARGVEAMANDSELALELFTAVTELEPDFADGWAELGTVNLALEAHDAAVLDLERALQLEPRHYDALLGLAVIFETYGNKKAALDALRRAQAINPYLPDIDKRIKALSLAVEGQRI